MVATLHLTTVGRTTGRPLTVRLDTIPDGNRWVVVAYNGAVAANPDWYRNLVEAADVDVQPHGAELELAVARDATPAEREELWPRLVGAFGLSEADRSRPASDIPVVILETIQPGEAKPRKRSFMAIGGAAVGSAMAGLESAAFRSLPPPIEVVEQHRHGGPIATDDGHLIILPEIPTRR